MLWLHEGNRTQMHKLWLKEVESSIYYPNFFWKWKFRMQLTNGLHTRSIFDDSFGVYLTNAGRRRTSHMVICRSFCVWSDIFHHAVPARVPLIKGLIQMKWMEKIIFAEIFSKIRLPSTWQVYVVIRIPTSWSSCIECRARERGWVGGCSAVWNCLSFCFIARNPQHRTQSLGWLTDVGS